MILVIDHYDSFVYNLARYAGLAGMDYSIYKYDELSVHEVEQMAPEAIFLSPGPCAPDQAGISVELVKRLGPEIPILGVCLGHQCIGQAYGGHVVRSNPAHGQASRILHDGSGVFAGLPEAFEGGRYHSLSVELPEDASLKVTARTEDGIIMGLQHKTHPIYGVQFHPESILTTNGLNLIKNFIAIIVRWNQAKKAAA